MSRFYQYDHRTPLLANPFLWHTSAARLESLKLHSLRMKMAVYLVNNIATALRSSCALLGAMSAMRVIRAALQTSLDC